MDIKRTIHLRSAKQNKAGSDSNSDTVRTAKGSDLNMADGGIPTSPTIPEGVNLEDLPDRKLLLQILDNQKAADKKSDDIYTAMNDNNISIATYIVAMKAFDTVNHNILSKKARKYGIMCVVYEWLKDYLK